MFFLILKDVGKCRVDYDKSDDLLIVGRKKDCFRVENSQKAEICTESVCFADKI